jgi:hypothetical protein
MAAYWSKDVAGGLFVPMSVRAATIVLGAILAVWAGVVSAAPERRTISRSRVTCGSAVTICRPDSWST